MCLNSDISIIKTNKETYPRYDHVDDVGNNNFVKEMVAEAFRLQGYDAERFGTNEWNPLGEFINQGDCVLLKPNLVMDVNHLQGAGTDCLYTQPSIVSAVLDYVIIALKGRGRIIVGDAPMQSCNFENLLKTSGYDKLIAYYRKIIPKSISFDFKDFRAVKSVVKNGLVFSAETETDNVIIDLGKDSEFFGLPENTYKRMRVTNYDPNIMYEHHNVNKQEYCVNRDVLRADVIINMPKPKTHRKAGVTIAMKNLVGINSRKEFLPHHIKGSAEEGGDEYRLSSILKRTSGKFEDWENYYSQTKKNELLAICNNFLKRSFAFLSRKMDKDEFVEGSWSGNDTISKTICDLNKILLYADKEGVMQTSKQRKCLIVADMIVSGEKEGPVIPSPKPVGMVAVGENPISFDETIAMLMGAKIEKIPTFTHALNPKGKYILWNNNEGGMIRSNIDQWNGKSVKTLEDKDLLFFVPTEGWKTAFKPKMGDNR